MSGPAREMSDDRARQRDAERGVRGLLDATESPVAFIERMAISDETVQTLKTLEAHREDTQAERALRKASSRRREERASREDPDSPQRSAARRSERHSV